MRGFEQLVMDAQTDVMSHSEIRTSAKEKFVARHLTCNTTGSLEYTDWEIEEDQVDLILSCIESSHEVRVCTCM